MQRLIKTQNWGCHLLMILKMNWKFYPCPSVLNNSQFCLVGKWGKLQNVVLICTGLPKHQIDKQTPQLSCHRSCYSHPNRSDHRPIRLGQAVVGLSSGTAPPLLHLIQPVPSPSSISGPCSPPSSWWSRKEMAEGVGGSSGSEESESRFKDPGEVSVSVRAGGLHARVTYTNFPML